MKKSDFEKLDEFLWEIPQTHRGDMRVPARVYATEEMLDSIVRDRSLEQLVNVATLPGIQKYAIAMPDVHEGYGFPIGGVAAVDARDGVVSPGGIGYDINCGVRLLRASTSFSEVEPRLGKLAHSIAREVPSGVGRGGALKLNATDFELVLRDGASRAIEMGYGTADDVAHIESNGKLDGAEPHLVSGAARERGHDQLGTIGSGNHFVEIDRVDTVYDADEASRLGIAFNSLVVQIHTGSRGLGHQVATDSLRVMTKVMAQYGIEVADRELACAPLSSREGQKYLAAMAAAANFAFANRQVITAGIRRAWQREFPDDPVAIVYDVAHNVAKVERYGDADVVVHRKGATRAFPGQPVLIPGSMGTASYLLVGQDASMTQTFGSSCHGAGRMMSRTRARNEINAEELRGRLRKLGIVAEAGSSKGLVEEAPEAYKDIDAVVDVVARAGIAKKVARFVPIAVIKG
ncbi:MAG: RtcB family protein [Acidobacteria bacterium]|nr:RtcB family protein [Acidobacteriota bacterium]MBV9477949.1 RtcB family protein [Acidobacteriota bacterium]